jgi:hypothetical protein
MRSRVYAERENQVQERARIGIRFPSTRAALTIWVLVIGNAGSDQHSSRSSHDEVV